MLILDKIISLRRLSHYHMLKDAPTDMVVWLQRATEAIHDPHFDLRRTSFGKYRKVAHSVPLVFHGFGHCLALRASCHLVHRNHASIWTALNVRSAARAGSAAA